MWFLQIHIPGGLWALVYMHIAIKKSDYSKRMQIENLLPLENMMTKDDHIYYWIQQANDDWKAVNTLFKGKNYLQSLFFAHLVIEKICKSIWIRHNEENIPPRTHNLIHLLSSTPIKLADDMSELILSLNKFQLEGRYPDYLTKMHTICNEKFTKSVLDKTNILRLWLLEKVR